jgi:myo-inositol-1(or 4)-monophosphatase
LTDWLAICRGAVDDVRGVLAELPSRAEREPVLAQGEGGDDTTAIDAAAERVILARFDGLDVTIVSEEVGEVGDGRWRVVVDPIDGSLNAKRGIPFFSLSIAVADGDTMADVEFAYVYDFGSGEEWTARRGEGAFLNGEPLDAQRPKDKIEILAFEATLTSSVAEKGRRVRRHRVSPPHHGLARTVALSPRRRPPRRGLLLEALSLGGRGRGQLLVVERGLSIANADGGSFAQAPLDLEPRSRVAAAGTDELCQLVISGLSA